MLESSHEQQKVHAVAETFTPVRRRLRFAPSSGFARSVDKRVRSEFAEANESRFAGGWQWAQALACLAGGICAYVAMLLGGFGAGGTLALAITASFCAFMFLVTLAHGATHGSASPRQWLNDTVVFVGFALLGVSGALWRNRHLRLHHQFANAPGTGIDADSSSALRLSPHKPWLPIHAWQPLYAPLLYAFGFIYLIWVEDFLCLAEARRSSPAQFRNWRALAVFGAAKGTHIVLCLIIPAVLLQPSLAALLAVYLLAMVTASIAFTLLAVGTHISDLAEFPMPDANGQLPYDWATHQVLTSVDWAPTNKWVTLLIGGANAEAAHHLFPNYSHRHAARLSRIIREEVAAHGIDYHSVTFGGMMRAHWRLVMRLSQPGVEAIAASGIAGHKLAPELQTH